MKKIILIISIVTFSISSLYAEEPPVKGNDVIKEFNNAQFITSLNQPKEVVKCFLYIVDNSSLCVNIDSWNYFVSKINEFQAAYKASLRGWSIDFDSI